MATKKTKTVVKKAKATAVLKKIGTTKATTTLKPLVSTGIKNAVSQVAQRVATTQPISSTQPGSSSTPSYDTSAYDNAIAAYEQKMKADAESAKQAKAAEYDAQAKAAYISRLQNQRTLNDNLLAAGIRGGATETANAKMLANYENNRNQIAQSKASALTSIDKDANDKMFDYRQAQEAAKLQYIQNRQAEDRQIAETKRQEAVQAAEAEKERAYNAAQAKQEQKWQEKQTAAANKLTKKENSRQNYVATITRYNTVAKCDKAIKAAKKKGETWKVKYIQAQKADLQNKAKEKKEAAKKKK